MKLASASLLLAVLTACASEGASPPPLPRTPLLSSLAASARATPDAGAPGVASP